MKLIQVINGYLIIYSALSMTVGFISLYASVIIFSVIAFFIKISPHPSDHQNPFAFALRFRSKREGRRH